MLVLSLKLPSSTWRGRWFLEKDSEMCIRLLCVSPEEESGPCPSVHYCFLTAFPFFLHFLTPLISNSLNLLFVTQGRSRRLNFFLQARNGGHGKAFVLPRAPQGPAQFYPAMGKWSISAQSTMYLDMSLISFLQWILFPKWLFPIFQTSYFFFHSYLFDYRYQTICCLHLDFYLSLG